MKFIFTFLATAGFSYSTFAQTSKEFQLPSQLRRVMANAAIEFKSFIGEKIKQDGTNTIYSSTLKLEGTLDNQVLILPESKYYSAKLGESLNEKDAAAIVESWKSKISNIVGQSFEVVSDNLSKDKFQKIGYAFMWNKLNISVHAIKQNDNNTYTAFITVVNH